MQSFRTLDLANEYYRATRNIKLPPHLKDQFLRSSSSVALNLAEGNAKMSRKEKLRFYEIAHGSFRESVAILDLEQINDHKVREIADHLGASLFKLTRAFIKDFDPKSGV
jgi:four helix bundle protein